MTKILLVEDDNALREIYGTRLVAEGYDVVSAADGEAALAMAIKEHPDLILSDIMMPKVSGFEMIDILKSTTETKNIKIVVMTALSNDSQRERGESLGVDRYLVKSQVGIEDVVGTIHELLGDGAGVPSAPPTAETAPTTAPEPAATPAPAATTLNEQGMINENSLDFSSADKKVIQPLDPNLTLHDDSSTATQSLLASPPPTETTATPAPTNPPEPVPVSAPETEPISAAPAAPRPPVGLEIAPQPPAPIQSPEQQPDQPPAAAPEQPPQPPA